MRNLGVTVFLVSSLDHYQREEKILRLAAEAANVSITKCFCGSPKTERVEI